VSSDFDKDDFARLLALEYAFNTLALISASNHAHLSEIKPSQSVSLFREAIEGAMYDSKEYPAELRNLMKKHLKRMFDHVESMAVHADRGFQNLGQI